MASSIGLDIGTSAVRAVKMSSGGPPSLDVFGQVMLPPGTIRNGEPVDPGAITRAIEQLFKTTKFGGKKVVLGVANQQVVVRQVELPALPEKELRESLPFQVQDYIPIPVDQAQLNFRVLNEFQSPDGQKMLKILLVAAASDVINQYLDIVKAAKLKPVSMALDAFAIVDSLGTRGGLGGDPRAGEMLVNIGADVTNIVVQAAGEPRFVRILMMGGNDVTESIVQAASVSREQAEQMKTSGSLPPGEATQVVSERTERIVSELRGSMDYFRSQQSDIAIRQVVVSGGGSLLPGLGARLGDALGVPTLPGRPLQALNTKKVSKNPDELAAAEPFLSVAIGLAMKGLTL